MAVQASACDGETTPEGADLSSRLSEGASIFPLDFATQPKVIESTLPLAPSHMAAYDCMPGVELDGAERVYELKLDAPGQIAAEIELIYGTNAAVLIMQKFEDRSVCLAGDRRRAVAEDLDPGTYWIVVEGGALAGRAMEYRLAVEPEAYDQWVEREVAPGITWQRYFGHAEAVSMNVLRFSPEAREAGAEIGSVHSGGDCETVDDMGRREQALAGINGTFFRRTLPEGARKAPPASGSMISGPPADLQCNPIHGMVKVDGEVVRHNLVSQMTLGVSVSGELDMKDVVEGDDWADMPTAIGGYPSLIPYEDVGDFATWHAPRTLLGLSAEGELIMVTVDGRTPVGSGMQLPKAVELMRELGAETAMNLDGGGSTTMWIHGTTLNGIVNYPSDRWMPGTHVDHQNPRGVSDALFIFQ